MCGREVDPTTLLGHESAVVELTSLHAVYNFRVPTATCAQVVPALSNLHFLVLCH